MEPQRQPYPKQFTVFILRILTEIKMNASGIAKKITGMANGSAGTQDACTVKQMEDHVLAAIGDNVSKDPVHAGTTAALPANTRTADVLKADAVGAFPTIDGVAPVINQYYIVKNEGGGASHINNGIYELTVLGDGVTEWELTRRHDMEGGEGASGAMVPISDGTINGDTTFKCINNIGSDTINTDALEFWFWGQTTDHGNLKNVTKDQHHNEDHQARHQSGGADELDVEGLPTSETDFQKLLRVDAVTPGDLEFVDFPLKGYAQGHSNNPPGAPSAKDLWMIDGVPTGAWVGHANEIGVWDGASWDFYSPTQGDTYWSIAETNYFHFTGSAWELFGTLISHSNLQDVTANNHHTEAHQIQVSGGPHTGTLPEGEVTFDDATGHKHTGAAGSGTPVDHSDTAGKTTDDHHAQLHAASHKDGGGDELDVSELAGALGGAGEVPETDGAAVSWVDPDGRYDPKAHALGGSGHSGDTKANLDTKVSDASLLSSLGNEFDVLFSEKAAPTGADKVVIEDAAASDAKKYVQLKNHPLADNEKAGIVAPGSFSGIPRKATITFNTAMPDNNYAVVISGEDARNWRIESKSSAGFTINAASAAILAGNTFWIARVINDP